MDSPAADTAWLDELEKLREIEDALAALEVDPPPPQSLKQSLTAVERREVIAALKRTNGRISKAARVLGISRDILYRRMLLHGIPLTAWRRRHPS